MSLIFAVDDETAIRKVVADILKQEGHTIKEFATSKAVLGQFAKQKPELILLDLWLESETSGMETLAEITKMAPNIPVIVISGHGTVDNAVHAVKLGAYDFIEKPFGREKLLVAVHRALENARLKKELANFETHRNFDFLFCGKSKAVRELKDIIKKAAPSNARILISGQSGTGKRAVAEKIHQLSKARGDIFLINCGSLQPQYLSKIVSQANNGTIYLDDVHDLEPECVMPLLKTLQQNKEQAPRFIASSNADLKTTTNEGKFSAELYYRLAVFNIELPALQQRAEDIPLLVKNFIGSIVKDTSYQFSKAALTALQTHSWDGNLWELRSTVDRIQALAKVSGKRSISLSMLPQEIQQETQKNTAVTTSLPTTLKDTPPLKQARRQFERNYLLLQLKRCNGNIRQVSELSGIERTALYAKLKSLGIDKLDIAESNSNNPKKGNKGE